MCESILSVVFCDRAKIANDVEMDCVDIGHVRRQIPVLHIERGDSRVYAG